MTPKQKTFPFRNLAILISSIILVPFLILISIWFAAPDKYAQWFLGKEFLTTEYVDTPNSYTVEYPRTWVRGFKPNGDLYLSPADFTYQDMVDHNFPQGLISIQISDSKNYESLSSYVDALQKNEKESEEIITGVPTLPTTPGTSSISIIGQPTIPLPDGFEEVHTLLVSMLAQQSETRLYWSIHNTRLYEFLVQYPGDVSQRSQFDAALSIVAKSLTIK